MGAIKVKNPDGSFSYYGGIKGDKGDPGTPGINGTNGWSPVINVVADGERRVLQVTDWTGGTGTKPGGGYITASGTLSAVLANGADVRGAAGPTGATGGGDMLLGTAQVVTATKTFAAGTLLVRDAAGTAHQPYSDANPPQALEMTQGATPTNPPAGEGTLWTTNAKDLWIKAPDGTDTQIGPSAGGDSPPWAGLLHVAQGNGEPEWEMQWNNLWGTGTTALTPTGVTATVARIWTYRSKYAITVNRLRWFAVAGTAGASTFRLAIYSAQTGNQVLAPQTLTFTGADRWTSHQLSPALTLAADTLYYFALSATATSTTWSLKASGIPATFPPLINSQPGNISPSVVLPANQTWFGQMAVTAGAMPATLNPVRGTGWTVGGIPFFYLDNNNAA